VSYLEKEISGVVVVNQTGMKDYIPENILVYIATDKKSQGKRDRKRIDAKNY